MKKFALGIAMTLAACSASAFEINLSAEERSQFNNKVHLQDLLVGDAMRIGQTTTCLRGNKLYVYGLAGSVEETKWLLTFKAEIKPGRTASLTIVPPEDPTRDNMQIWVQPCERLEAFWGVTPDQFIAISEINGFKDLRSLYDSPEFQNLPFE